MPLADDGFDAALSTWTAGFTIKQLVVLYENGASRLSGADSLGVARSR